MKKSLFLILFIAFVTLVSNAQIIKSWDFEDGTLVSWGSFSAPVAAVANPNTTGNPSAFCGSLDQSGGAWNGFRLWSDPPILSTSIKKLKVDVYLASAGLIQLYMDNAASGAATYTKQATGIAATTWTTLEFDLTALPAYDYKQIAFQSNIVGVILFDNIKLLGANGEPKPVEFDELIIARETFGTKVYDTNNPTPQASGWGSGAAWHFNWYDVTSFTSTNGNIESGSDSSIRINTYLSAAKPAEWLEPSGGAHLLMTSPTRYSGSWDTICFKGIDITNQIVSCVEFGWAKRGNQGPKDSINGFNVEIRIDGGEWIQLDTTLLTNPLGGDKWAYAHLPVNRLKGSSMDVRIACGMVNQIFIDDITVKGLAYVQAPITKETFGTMVYDTNNPTPQASGWGSGAAWHYNWYDVKSFTSKNGNIESGSDSSIRINTYLSAAKPAEWLNPSGGSHLLMTSPTRYSGSWDTIMFKNINIEDQIVSSVEFGWAKRGNQGPKDSINGFNVEIRIDGGEWIQLDTTLLTNPLGGDKWAYAVLPVSVNGKKMDIRFACGTVNQIFIDDIMVNGAVPAPKGINDFAIEKVIFGTVDNAADYTGNLNMKWDADNIYLTFDIADDSIVNKGTAYQVDNIEVYFDMDNSKNIHWPRNGGWVSNDPTYDANDYQLRLVPDSAFSVNNTKFDADQVYTKTETGYQFKLTIAWDSLMAGFEPAIGTQIGFDVLVSDNDAVASDPNRNQITLFTPSGMIYNDPSFMTTIQFEGLGTFSIIPDTIAPAIVTNLAVAVTKNAAKLTWDNATDNIAIYYYNIYQDGALIKEKQYAAKTGNTLTVKNLADGDYVFTIETVDNFGNVSATKATANATVLTVAVDNLSASKLAVYPNPAISELNIKGVENISKIEVIGITGNILNVHNGSSSISVANLSKGAYFLKVYTDKEVLTTRFLKD